MLIVILIYSKIKSYFLKVSEVHSKYYGPRIYSFLFCHESLIRADTLKKTQHLRYFKIVLMQIKKDA